MRFFTYGMKMELSTLIIIAIVLAAIVWFIFALPGIIVSGIRSNDSTSGASTVSTGAVSASTVGTGAVSTSTVGTGTVSTGAVVAKLQPGCWKVSDGRPHVYKMTADGKLCHVPNPDAYTRICGPQWSSHGVTTPNMVPAENADVEKCVG